MVGYVIFGMKPNSMLVYCLHSCHNCQDICQNADVVLCFMRYIVYITAILPNGVM